MIEQAADREQRVRDLHRRNDQLAQSVLQTDREIRDSELNMRAAALEMAANLEELYSLKAFELPINCIFSVILTALKKNGLTENGRRALYRIFDTEETKKYRYLTQEKTSYECDNVTNIANSIHEELETQQKQITETINTLKNFDCMPAFNKDLYRDATESLLDVTQVMVQNCDNHGILLLQHTTQQQKDRAKKLDACRIKKPEPMETDLTKWLDLLIEELQKVRQKFYEYPPKAEDAYQYCQGIKVHVQLLRSIIDDKWARNYWSWLGVIKEMKRQSKHSAMSKSGIMGTQGRIRKLTREQIGDKAEDVLEFAMQFIEHSYAYWDCMHASIVLREPQIAQLHLDRGPKLSDSS